MREQAIYGAHWLPSCRQNEVCYEGWLRDLLALRLPLETNDKPADFGGLFILTRLPKLERDEPKATRIAWELSDVSLVRGAGVDLVPGPRHQVL